MCAVITLVLAFRTSSNLTAAYGIAVTGAMFIDTCLLAVVLLSLWKWNRWLALAVLTIFFVVDLAYFSSNLLKVPSGGWFPLVIGLIVFTLLTTWAKGRKLLAGQIDVGIPLEVFVKSAVKSALKAPGTAIYLTSRAAGVPHAILHNLKHNHVIHERSVFLNVAIEDVPIVDERDRAEVTDLGSGFYRVKLRYGFMEDTDIPAALATIDMCGERFDMMRTSFFLSRQTPLPSEKEGMAIWRETLFAWMMRNAESPMEFFGLPPNRVVEMGSQVKI